MRLVGSYIKIDKDAQPSGVPQHGKSRGGAQVSGPDGLLLALHERLCELMPDAAERMALLQVPANVEAAWLEGKMLLVLRARRKPLESAVQQLERAASFGETAAPQPESTDA
ncbi:MAG: hypothetical protein ABI200_02525 [Gaiellales bacterium]